MDENGIEFAHRNVTLYLPPGEGDRETNRQAIEAGAAAAAAAQAADEQLQQRQKSK